MQRYLTILALLSLFSCPSCGSDADGVAEHPDRPGGEDGDVDSGNPGTSEAGDDAEIDGESDVSEQVCAPLVATWTCDTLPPQCGCPEGKSCEANHGDGSTQCFQSQGIEPKHACSVFGDCVAGYTCVDKICKLYCNKDTDCPGQLNGAKCVQIGMPMQTGQCNDIPYAKACTENCVPWEPDSCGTGMGCYPFTGPGVRPPSWTCLPLGGGTSRCSVSGTCSGGFASTLSDVCRKWCRKNKNDCDGAACSSVTVGGASGLYYPYDGDTWEIGICEN